MHGFFPYFSCVRAGFSGSSKGRLKASRTCRGCGVQRLFSGANASPARRNIFPSVPLHSLVLPRCDRRERIAPSSDPSPLIHVCNFFLLAISNHSDAWHAMFHVASVKDRAHSMEYIVPFFTAASPSAPHAAILYPIPLKLEHSEHRGAAAVDVHDPSPTTIHISHIHIHKRMTTPLSAATGGCS